MFYKIFFLIRMKVKRSFWRLLFVFVRMQRWLLNNIFSFLQGTDNCTNTYVHKKKMSVYEGWQDVFLCHHFFIFKFKFSRSLLPGESLVMILPKWWSVGLSFVCDVWSGIMSGIMWHTHTYTQRKKKNYDWTAKWKRKNRWILLDGKMVICFFCFFFSTIFLSKILWLPTEQTRRPWYYGLFI